MTIWIVGGRRRMSFRELHEWQRFDSALVLEIDKGLIVKALEYKSPPAHRPDAMASILFKAASIVGDTAYLCTQTEVLLCSFPSFQIKKVISLPCFNDLHHVVPGLDGTLFVTVTGLDAVAEITRDGELVRIMDVMGGNVWDRFARNVDYRKVLSTKPHRSHPNWVFFLAGKPWVTRLEQRDAVALDDVRQRISIHNNPIHDGHVQSDRVFFTSVDGHVIVYDLKTRSTRLYDLNLLNDNPKRPLGWCRGVLPTKHGVWVGFTRIRPTRLKHNLSWIHHGFRDHSHLPTRIALYDLDNCQLKKEYVLESDELGAVFSIHSMSDELQRRNLEGLNSTSHDPPIGFDADY